MAWDARNEEVHDKTSGKALAHEEQECEAEVNAIYAVKDQLSAYDQQILDIPIEERLNNPTRVIRRWIEIAKPLVRDCIRDQTHRLQKGHKDIRSFFMDT